MKTLRLIWTTSRPGEWPKNLVLLAPLILSENVLNFPLALRTSLAVLAFVLASASNYLLNDISNIQEDRRHSLKRHRPLASGELALFKAIAFMGVGAALSLALSYRLATTFGVIVSSYLVINIFYTKVLRQIVILDILAIASGFVLRVIGGAAVIGVESSHWLLICTGFLALLLALTKRRQEISTLNTNTESSRSVLTQYSLPFLDVLIVVVTTSTLMTYSLYTLSQETIQKLQTDKLVFTIPFVIYGVFRYLYLVYHREQGGNPVQNILLDIPLFVTAALWAAALGLALWLPSQG